MVSLGTQVGPRGDVLRIGMPCGVEVVHIAWPCMFCPVIFLLFVFLCLSSAQVARCPMLHIFFCSVSLAWHQTIIAAEHVPCFACDIVIVSIVVFDVHVGRHDLHTLFPFSPCTQTVKRD